MATARKTNRKQPAANAATTTNSNPAATVASAAAADPLALQAAVWAFVGKAASTNGARDDMADGQHNDIKLAITAEIDGQRYQMAYQGTVDVGHASTRASSVGPDQDELLGLILSKLNAVTRDKICRDLASEFAASGGQLPPVDAAIVNQAEKLRADLRQQVNQSVRGSVRCVVQPATQPLINVVS